MAGQGVKELKASLEKTWLPSDTEDTTNPSYYKTMPKGVEVHEIIETVVNRDQGFVNNVSYSDLGHIIRYILRLGEKNGSLQELKKARWYLDKIIEREEALGTERVPKKDGALPKMPERAADLGFKGSWIPEPDYPDEAD